jgi:DUF4097 and DUF4098 domain-containing protein YvlB
MRNQMRKPVFTFVGSVVSIILLAGCVVHVGAGENSNSWSDGKNYSEVNKSISIGDGKTVGNVSSVNGGLKLGDNVDAGKVSSVNGRLRVGSDARVDELSTVNGSLSSDEGLRSAGDVSTVNGSIKLKHNSNVGGTVSTVNGSINLEGVSIEKNIETVNGSIYLEDNTSVNGDIVFQWNKRNNYQGKDPKLVIESGSIVEGQIILQRPVELDIEDKSTLDKVVEDFQM